jgi:nucleoside 2-deoxyribosyltransferase
LKSVYVIGSLRNPKIPILANALRRAGFDAFDSWYAPGPKADDFWRDYTKARGLTYKEALQDWSARQVFHFDKTHLDRCDMAVMLMPAGKSGHLELGYMIGRGKKAYILFDKEPKRYDVMVQFATDIFLNQVDLINALRKA